MEAMGKTGETGETGEMVEMVEMVVSVHPATPLHGVRSSGTAWPRCSGANSR